LESPFASSLLHTLLSMRILGTNDTHVHQTRVVVSSPPKEVKALQRLFSSTAAAAATRLVAQPTVSLTTVAVAAVLTAAQQWLLP
jgi:hypothetical protein